jgi:hypothetical protein
MISYKDLEGDSPGLLEDSLLGQIQHSPGGKCQVRNPVTRSRVESCLSVHPHVLPSQTLSIHKLRSNEDLSLSERTHLPSFMVTEAVYYSRVICMSRTALKLISVLSCGYFTRGKEIGVRRSTRVFRFHAPHILE